MSDDLRDPKSPSSRAKRTAIFRPGFCRRSDVGLFRRARSVRCAVFANRASEISRTRAKTGPSTRPRGSNTSSAATRLIALPVTGIVPRSSAQGDPNLLRNFRKSSPPASSARSRGREEQRSRALGRRPAWVPFGELGHVCLRHDRWFGWPSAAAATATSFAQWRGARASSAMVRLAAYARVSYAR